MSDRDLMTDGAESPSAMEGNVEELGAKLFEGIFDTELDANASKEVEEPDVDDQEEEVVSEEEEPADDASVEESDEVEETVEEDEDDQEEFSGDIDVMSITELAEQVGKIEINGEEYTPAQLKSILGQETAAGTKAREASAKLKEVEAREAKIAEQEEWLTQRTNAAATSDQLVEMQSEARKINASLQKAREEGDMYEVAVQKDKLEVLGQDYQKAQQEVQVVQQRQNQEMMAKVEQGLKDRNLGYLLQENDDSKAWTEYASSRLNPQELQTVLMIPAVAEAIEKARKWDGAGKKSNPQTKLKSSTKTLTKGTGNKLSSQQSKAKQAQKARLRKGEGFQEDVDAAALRVAKAFFN